MATSDTKTCGSCRFASRPPLADPCKPCVMDDGKPNWEAAESPQRLKLTPPDTNPKTRYGMAKPPISLVPPVGVILMAEAFRDGAVKYGPANWRKDPVSASTYLNAAYRHLMAWQDGEDRADDSGVHHLGHAAACLAILMDAEACGTLLDDRAPEAPTAGLMRTLTRPID